MVYNIDFWLQVIYNLGIMENVEKKVQDTTNNPTNNPAQDTLDTVKKKKKIPPKAQTLTYIALSTAITCIIGPLSIVIPISPVPISLTILAIYISVYAIGLKRGMVSLLLYFLIGFIGLPVFSNFKGGFQVLIGPTGGYIIGFIFVILSAGIFIERYETKVYMHIIGMVLGTILCYILGSVWLAYQGNMTFLEALFAGVIPFIWADAIKIIIAAIVGPKLRRALRRI